MNNTKPQFHPGETRNDTNGVPIFGFAAPPATPAPILCIRDVWKGIAAMLDSAESDLDAGAPGVEPNRRIARHLCEGSRQDLSRGPSSGSGSIFTELLLASAYSLTGQQAEAHEALQRYLALPGVATKSIAQLRAQQLALANNPTWVADNERLFDGLRQAGCRRSECVTAPPR